MMPSNNILDLNSKGVEQMRKGSYQGATACFRLALKQLFSNDNNCSNREPQDVEGGAHAFQPVLSNDLVQSINISETGSASFQEQHPFSLFARAFVTSTNKATSLSSRVARDKMTAAILYNMGLAHHLLGIRDSINGQMNLKHALKFYQMAMEVLGRTVSIDETKLMFLAIVNNMGSIYSQNFERNKVRVCLEWMAVSLKSLNSTTRDDKDLGEEYLHFQMNIVFRKTKVSPAA
jgi:hypothetical protein